VKREEWEGIPEAATLTSSRHKRNTHQRYTPVTDSVIASALNEGRTSTSVETMGTETAVQNLTELGQAKKNILSLEMDKVSESVVNTSRVNQSGYLTGLASMQKPEAELK